jgi:hypothetical protein
MVGGDAIEISGYRPDVSDEKYCAAFPSNGKIVFVFDLTAPAMRNLPIEIRIVKDPMIPRPSSADLSSLTIAYVEPRVFKNGTFSFEHSFVEGGHYIALITVAMVNSEKVTGQFKFSPGTTFLYLKTFLYFLPIVLAAVSIGAALFIYWRRVARKRSPPAAI